jgi:hypothetical protein
MVNNAKGIKLMLWQEMALVHAIYTVLMPQYFDWFQQRGCNRAIAIIAAVTIARRFISALFTLWILLRAYLYAGHLQSPYLCQLFITPRLRIQQSCCIFMFGGCFKKRKHGCYATVVTDGDF